MTNNEQAENQMQKPGSSDSSNNEGIQNQIDSYDDWNAAQIVQYAGAGSAQAFGLLVERYESGIYQYLMHSLGNHEDASDYTQQVFLKAWLNLASLQNDATFKVWLHSIARNLLRDNWRAQKITSHSWEELAVGGLDISRVGPEDEVLDAELMRLALSELSPKLRVCLVLRLVMNYSPQEIATLVGISVTSVGTYISLARRQLMVIFQRLQNEPSKEPKMIVQQVKRPTMQMADLDKLQEPYRTAIHLHYFEELTYPEIATKLNLSIGTVKSHVSRGMKMLFSSVDPEWGMES